MGKKLLNQVVSSLPREGERGFETIKIANVAGFTALYKENEYMADLRIPEQNHILLTGRLTHDPDLRFTQKGQPVCSFDIAVNRRYKDTVTGEWKDDTTFVPIVVWAQMGERCKERLKKGSPVHVEGRISSSEYTDKNGQKHRVLRVVAKRVQFLAVQRSGPTDESSDVSETTPDFAQKGLSPEKELTEIDEVPF